MRGLTAAHNPKAPSTCTHAPAARAAVVIAARSSKAPVLTFPACAHTIVGLAGVDSRRDASTSAFIAPFDVAGISWIALSPSPSSRTVRSIVAWRSAPANTLTSGASRSPSRPTSQPCLSRTCHRAQLRVGLDGAIVVAEASRDHVAPSGGGMSQLVKLRVADVDAAFARAREAGVIVLEELTTFEYGERSGVAEDLAGHRWEPTQALRDVAPEEWGGPTIAPW